MSDMSNTSILSVESVSKTYNSGDRELTVLHDISFSVERGASMSIIGPSGSGKTTLLGLCAGLDSVSKGQIVLNGSNLDQLDEDDRALLRNKYVGFVFQNFQLIPTLNALENVMVPAELRGETGVYDRAVELLVRVGLKDRLDHYPIQLSGGEQQRVALARAFINQPVILFVDEPTGNLDTETSENVEQLLFQLNEEAGTTLILVTHDMELARKTHRILRLRGGKIAEDINQLELNKAL